MDPTMILIWNLFILINIVNVLSILSTTNDNEIKSIKHQFNESNLTIRQLSSNSLYTSFQCIGGSQVMDTNSMKQASVTIFPLNDAAHRTCLFRNLCSIQGQLTYYSKYLKSDSIQVPMEYLPKGFKGNIFHVAYLRAFTLPIKTIYSSIPEEYSFSKIDLTFLDANSWSFNYGHYLIDNVIPAFMASKLFNLQFDGSQQLYETTCRLFSILEPAFSERIVTYNRSMGTYQQACLAKLNGMNHHFFNHPPMYLDQLTNTNICFNKLMVGHGSTFGLKSIDLSRAYFLKEFRDYVIQRIISQSPSSHTAMPPQENLILIGLRTVGSAGGRVINELCEATTEALKKNPSYHSSYKTECFIPSDLSFEDEIRQVQRAKVIVSVHGTISYMALFTRDGTQQISIASPKELKENQILLYATHFYTLYLTWDKLHQLPGVLHHALTLSDQYYNN